MSPPTPILGWRHSSRYRLFNDYLIAGLIIKKHRRGTYTTLLTTFNLNEHLYEVDTEAHRMVVQITAQLAAERGIDESLKAFDPLRWVQEMNNCKQAAEEQVIRKVICK